MNESSDRDDRGRFASGNTLGFASNPENINRSGRPSRPSITAALVRRLKEPKTDGEASGDEIVEALVKSAVREALKGSLPHLREIWTRIDGKDSTMPEIIEGEEPVSVEEHRMAAISLYRSIIIDPSASPRDRLSAQEGLNRLLGLVDEQAGNTAEETAAAIRAFLTETETKSEELETPEAPRTSE